MFFRQYYLQCLSHASYMIGDEHTGRAVVVDPRRDVQDYLDDAKAERLRIERVIETHFHADFVSGHLELAERCGALISYGDQAQTEFPMEPLHDGQQLPLGEVTLEILLTPGHTPESLSVVVYERADDSIPYGVLTGDTMFIGDVGRPDLLSSVGVGADELARSLYHSLHEKLLALPDATRVFPAHGAGSACGKSLSTATSSTIGEERRANYALAPMTEDEFVHAVTEGQTAAPSYFSFSAARNRQQRTVLDEDAAPPLLSIDEVLERMRQGAVVIDTRDPSTFAQGHLRGSVNVGLQGCTEYAGNVIDAGRDIVLVGDPGTTGDARVKLSRIGFDTVIGDLDDPLKTFLERPELVEQSSRLTAQQFAARADELGDLAVLDVRNPGETVSGKVPGARNIPLASLLREIPTLDVDRPTVVYCAGGYRSSIAASTLRAHGFRDVSDIVGGYEALRLSGSAHSPAE